MTSFMGGKKEVTHQADMMQPAGDFDNMAVEATSAVLEQKDLRQLLNARDNDAIGSCSAPAHYTLKALLPVTRILRFLITNSHCHADPQPAESAIASFKFLHGFGVTPSSYVATRCSFSALQTIYPPSDYANTTPSNTIF